ncbi:MAG: AraC family transcriptional regulator, partial [Bacteroidia bacterium]|nr:AraC family transcriptional regulator [Bacteroidia bacterium]
MHNPPDILTLAYKQAPMQEQMTLLQEKEQQIPGSVQYTIKRYHRNLQWNIEDTGMMVYHYEKAAPRENYFEL